MKAILSSTALIVGLISSAGVYAAAPAGATGLCKDGSYNTSANKQGACRGHKGIQEWYGETGTTAAPTTPAAPAQMTKITKTTSSTADLTSSTSSTGATGVCKDGTYYTGANKQGACRGHKGIQTWYADTAATVKTTAPTMTQTKVTKSTTTTSAAPSGTAPAGSTGLCNDGSYYAGANKQGACRGHKGIKDWYGSAASGAATVGATAAVTTPAATPTSVPEKKGTFSFLNKKPATSPTTAATPTTTSTATTTTQTAPKTVAAGGGVGQVWVNSDSNVYHCQSSQWYGKTKTGSYMTEAAAKAAGARPDHGKACS